MNLWLIVGVALLILCGLLVYVLSIPVIAEKKAKRQRREPPPEPPKDWEGIAGRLEKRLQAQESTLKSAQAEVNGRDKKIAELNETLTGIKKQFEQEKVWREKEEAVVEKEKKQERVLQEELTRSRAALDQELQKAIKQESELKELRKAREEVSSEARHLNTKSMDLDRRLNEALKEIKQLREENMVLKQKKEDEEWVAKSDYKRLETLFKRARWEAEQFKTKVPEDQWPNALKSRKSAEPEKVQPAVPPTEPAKTDPAPSGNIAPAEPAVSDQPQAGPESQKI